MGGSCAGGLAHQVVALGDDRGPRGGLGVRRGGSRQVALELVQVPADGVPPVPVVDHPAQPVGLAQSLSCTQHMADGVGPAEHGSRVLAYRVVAECD